MTELSLETLHEGKLQEPSEEIGNKGLIHGNDII